MRNKRHKPVKIRLAAHVVELGLLAIDAGQPDVLPAHNVIVQAAAAV